MTFCQRSPFHADISHIFFFAVIPARMTVPRNRPIGYRNQEQKRTESSLDDDMFIICHVTLRMNLEKNLYIFIWR